jgi:hypothetical protein
LAPSSWNWTPTTATLSEALAETVMLPLTVAPALGDEMVAVGGVVSEGGPFETVTEMEADVVVLPAASRALALRVWLLPLAAVVVSQATEYGAVVSSTPKGSPSSRNWTPATPTLSEAAAVTATAPLTVDPEAGEVIATVGGVWSETVTLTGAEVVALPAASRATAVSVWVPAAAPVVSHGTE